MDNFNQLVNNPDLYALCKAFQNETFAKLNVMRIGVIDEILDDNQVRCSITNKKLMKTNPDGSGVWKNYPPIYARVWYMGSGSTGIDYPLTTGTPCLLLFNDREFSSYFTSGQVSPLSDIQTHSLSYAVAIPLYQPTVGTNMNLKSKTDIVLNAKNIDLTSETVLELNAITLNINATTINLTAATVNINGVLNINGNPYMAHTHTSTSPGLPTSGVNF